MSVCNLATIQIVLIGNGDSKTVVGSYQSSPSANAPILLKKSEREILLRTFA